MLVKAKVTPEESHLVASVRKTLVRGVDAKSIRDSPRDVSRVSGMPKRITVADH